MIVPKHHQLLPGEPGGVDTGGGLRDRPPCFLRSELMGCFTLESGVVAQEGVGTPWGEDDLAGRLRTSVLPLSGFPGALPRPGGPRSAPCPRGCQGAHSSPAQQLPCAAALVLGTDGTAAQGLDPQSQHCSQLTWKNLNHGIKMF